MNFLFRIVCDNIQTITSIYNIKINSIDPNEINNIITTIKQVKRLEGKEYTNGNLNRYI